MSQVRAINQARAKLAHAPPGPAAAPWRAPDDYAERVRAMGVKALRAEAALRGVDVRACVEKADIVRALEDNAAAKSASSAAVN